MTSCCLGGPAAYQEEVKSEWCNFSNPIYGACMSSSKPCSSSVHPCSLILGMYEDALLGHYADCRRTPSLSLEGNQNSQRGAAFRAVHHQRSDPSNGIKVGETISVRISPKPMNLLKYVGSKDACCVPPFLSKGSNEQRSVFL